MAKQKAANKGEFLKLLKIRANIIYIYFAIITTPLSSQKPSNTFINGPVFII